MEVPFIKYTTNYSCRAVYFINGTYVSIFPHLTILDFFFYKLFASDAPEPRLGSVLARALKKKARLGLGSLKFSKSSVFEIQEKRA